MVRPDFLLTLGSVAAVAVAIMLGIRAGRVRYLEGRLADQAGHISELQDVVEIRGRKNDDLASSLRELRAELAQARAEHDLTRQELAALSRVVTGEAYFVAIEQLQREHHAALLHELGMIRQHLEGDPA